MALNADGSALVSVAGEGEDGNNSALSSSATNYIVEADANEFVRYSLFVSNTGGAVNAQSITKLVLVNNLPEPGDHSTLYSEFDRYSTFAVEFAPSALLVPAVSVTVNGAETLLKASQYTLQFSAENTFDDAEDGTSNTVWTADALGMSDGWYTLEQLAAGAADLSAMRSMRVMIADETLVPAGAQVCVSYNARLLANDADTAADGSSGGEGSEGSVGVNSSASEVPEAQPSGASESAGIRDAEGSTGDSNEASETFDTEESVAWNSFGYAYTLVNGSKPLKAAADPVGVKTTSYPVLVKQLVGSDGNAATAAADQEFEFLVYAGSAVKGLSQTMGRVAALETLAANGRQAAIVPVTVTAGASQAEVSLAGLKAWSVDGDAARATDTSFTWTNNDRYTVMELVGGADGAANSGAGDERYTYKSINGSGAASTTFGYFNSTESEIVAVNATESFTITVRKIANDTSQALPGAVFAIYKHADGAVEGSFSTSQVATLTSLGVTSLPEYGLFAQDNYWEYADVRQSDAEGLLSFAGLTGTQYFVVELLPPQGYSIGSGSEQANTDVSGEGSEGVTSESSGDDSASSSGSDGTEISLEDPSKDNSAFNHSEISSEIEGGGKVVPTITYADGTGTVVNAQDAVDGVCYLCVRNYSSYTLPSSGGPGTWPFAAAGLALLLAATCAATRARRKLGQ
jgi:hypothetical protein